MANDAVFKILKGGQCYTPELIGERDILVIYNKIRYGMGNIYGSIVDEAEIIDCGGKIVCPCLIDQHVHITGGGGEQGPSSRIPELMLGEVLAAGVATLVGVLGFDSATRNIAGLLAKARALNEEGISTYIYTGSYSVPTATLTGKVLTDISYIDKVIGVGEIAISDHRSSYPSIQSLKELASETRIGGLIGKKAGIVHMHVGDGKEGLLPLIKLVEECDFPLEMFVPTHLNRNKGLFEQGIQYAQKGGYIDLTAGEKTGIGYSVPDAFKILLEKGVDIGRVTVSSDGNGSIPATNGGETGVGKVKQLYDDIRSCILEKNIDIACALKTVTENVAKLIKVYPRKGALMEGSDADILVLNPDDLSICHMLVHGEKFIENGQILKKGRYENKLQV